MEPTNGMPNFATRRPDWLSFDEALDRILSAAPDPPIRTRPLQEAAGLAVAREVRSPLTLPPGPTSHMDGYAVGPGQSSARTAFRVVGTSRPGAPWTGSLGEDTAIRIMTGALLPEGADRVVPVEETDREAGETGYVRIGGAQTGREGAGSEGPLGEPGRHVRPPGEEVREGEILASPGDTLGFGLLALLGVAGESDLAVHPAPRVALLVTGDELVPPGDRPALAGGVRRADILSPSLPILVRAAGGEPLPPARVSDTADALRSALASAADGAELVLTTGGASMGEADLVKDVLDELGFELDFWRIRMRPGSPVSFGRLPRPDGRGSVPVLSLPGNPVSAMVTCIVLGLPAIRVLGGHRQRWLRRIRATTREPLPGPERLTRFLRVRLDPEAGGRWGARPSAPQGSGVIRSMALADGLAVIPEGSRAPGIGDPVDVLLLPHAGWTDRP